MNKVNSTKKLWFCLSLLVVMAMTLSACGGAATPAPTQAPAPAAPATKAPVAAAPATEVPTAAPTTAAPTAEPTVAPTVDPSLPTPEPTAVVNAFGQCDRPLVLWHGLTGTDGAVFATLLEQFAKENPDVCLNSEGYPWDLFFQKYPTATAAGQPPDMVIFHAAEVQQMASQGLMTPLEDIMYADGTVKKADYNPTLIEQITADGKTMAVPFDNHGWMLWYNKELIKAAGLDPNKLPKNGKEFIEWAQKITTDVNGKHPLDAGFDKDNVQVWGMEFTWPRYTVPATLWQFGGGVLAPDNKTVILDSPESIAAIQYWHDMMYKYSVAPPAVPGKMWAGDLYKNDRLAFMWEGTWTKGFMNDNPDVWAKTGIDFVNSLAPDGKQAVKFDSHVMVIPAGVDEAGQAAAKKLMAWLAKNGAAWANSGQVPANIQVQGSLDAKTYPSVVVAAKQFGAIGRTDMASKYFIEIQTAYETAVGNALASADADVAKELKAGAEVIRGIVARP
jgi:ABC-type glycerol-3-phosphate transport system substrate-binding protein